jgi:hypothetical protein
MAGCKNPRWRRFWSLWAAVFALTGIVGDTYAYVGYGWEATLTASIRRWAGLEPKTAYARLGRTALLTFFAWCAVHLGWGELGPSRGRPRITQHFHNAAYDGEKP